MDVEKCPEIIARDCDRFFQDIEERILKTMFLQVLKVFTVRV